MHQAMKNVRHFIQSVRIMLWALVIAGRGAARRMALAAIFAAGCLAAPPRRRQNCRPASSICAISIRPSFRTCATPAPNNFVGRPLAGYQAAECVVKREVGALLKSVQEELALQNLSLKMFDCYRPTRAVADMVAWSRDGQETPAQKRYNPAFSKADLFRLGYIATHSRPFHRRRARSHPGRSEGRQFGRLRSGQGLWRLHRANVNLRAPDGSVDMGTGYDCSDVKSHTAAKSITRGPAPLAGEAGSADGAARICKLFEGVVALFAAGGGRAGL